MTRSNLYAAISSKFANPEFIEYLQQDTTGTILRLVKMFNARQEEAAWLEIEKLFDEFTFFHSFSNENIVCEEV